MTQQVDDILEKIQALEQELEVEFAKARAGLDYGLERGRARFEEEVKRRHEALRKGLGKYLAGASPLVVLTAPVIYSLIVPFVLVDLMVMAYQAICFPVYGIPKVRRRDYLVFDRHHLAYLNIIEKMNCAYCSYCNGVAGFVREVTARTEIYWCPIKHARRMLGPHPHYVGFADFGDAQGFRDRMAALKDGVKLDGPPNAM